MKLSLDINGNKVLQVQQSDIGGKAGFSIQTLDNLPETHRMLTGTFDPTVALAEVRAYVAEYGTSKQKQKLGITIYS